MQQALQAAAEELGLDIGHCEQALLRYLALLEKWNKAFNLTAIRKPEEMLVRHIFDSLAVAPHISASRYIDIGTGAGLPGVVLALYYPDKHFDLLDSNGKKTRFLNQVKAELALTNIGVFQARVETFQAVERYDGVLSRAFATLADMVNGSEHLLNDNGVCLAMKGVEPSSELSDLPKPFILAHCHRLKVPQLDEERHLVVLKKQ
jgi:16S rRNA (guanine527-N7)-methyltransferase